MLVVIPICTKDWALACENLDLCNHFLDTSQALFGGTRTQEMYDCLIAYDDTLPEQSLRDVQERAGRYFQSVQLFNYDPPATNKWPMAANHAWQTVARYIYHKHRGCNWLWWEADATPLDPGWLVELERAYYRGGRAMAGHIVMGMGHMNGVGIYPWNVLESAPHAMVTRHAAFDVVLGSEAGDQQHPLNHLIYHFPRANGLRVSVVDPWVKDKLLKLNYVLFHGCTDGSLAAIMRGESVSPVTDKHTRVFSLDDINVNPSEGECNWQHEFMRIHRSGWDAISHKEVLEPVPSVLKQTEWPCGFFNLPRRRGFVHFNCGLAKDGDGKLWLLARQWERRSPKDWTSQIVRCELTDTLAIKNTTPLVFTTDGKDDPFKQREDPRVMHHNGTFYVSYCSWTQRGIYRAYQAISSFDADWNLKETFFPAYGLNDQEADVPETGACEKNWVLFPHPLDEDDLYFVYSFSPHVVVRCDSLEAHKTQPPLTWRYGEIRGGTPPVRVGDEYITFFHSSLPWKKKQKRYFMGAYAFEAKPPFAVTRITKVPILAGSEDDPRLNQGPLVVFPCGALLEDDHWLVTFGVNDEACAWIQIPHADLEKRLLS